MSPKAWLFSTLLGSLSAVCVAATTTAPIRVASLTVEKRPPPARHSMNISTRPDETVIDYPTAKSKVGVVLAIDRCLAWGDKCDQPAADAVCRRYAPERPVAARYSLLQNAGATVIQSTGDYCWDTFCTALAQVRCVAKPSPVVSKVPVEHSAILTTPVVDPNTCKSGYVWRTARPEDLVCVTPAARQRTADENAAAPTRVDPNGAYGPATCVPGFVWREAFDGDTVCVTPETRDAVREENAAAASRRMGGSGP